MEPQRLRCSIKSIKLTPGAKIYCVKVQNDHNQALFDHLKCKCCENRLRAGKPRWYRCPSHHQICQDCKEESKKSTCPCGKPISDEYCPMTEKLLGAENTRFRCMNQGQGCPTVLAEKAMISHEVQCAHRLITCPDSTCRLKMPFSTLLEHMNRKSPGKLATEKLDNLGDDMIADITLSKEHFDNGNFAQKPLRIDYSDKVFIFTCNQLGETFCLWMWIVGSRIEAKKYYYTLKLLGTDRNVRISFTGQVVSIDETPNSIRKSGKCFGINFQTFKTLFMKENRKCTVAITFKENTLNE